MSASSSLPPPAHSASLAQPVQSDALGVLRAQIDELDAQLLALLNQRARVAEQVGELKRQEGTPFFRPDRVAQVIHKVQASNTGPLLNDHVASIWREIMSACLALEVPPRVAVLGPQGTFCEQAAIEYFGSAVNLVYCNSFDEVFHATAAGTAQFGVVGMENSTEGVVARSFDLFLRSPVHVVGEVSLAVRHNLLRQRNDLDGIEVVLAHPQALMQCQDWLAQHTPPRHPPARQRRNHQPDASPVSGLPLRQKPSLSHPQAGRSKGAEAHRAVAQPGACALRACAPAFRLF